MGWKCDQCDKRLTCNYYLNVHRQIHSKKSGENIEVHPGEMCGAVSGDNMELSNMASSTAQARPRAPPASADTARAPSLLRLQLSASLS